MTKYYLLVQHDPVADRYYSFGKTRYSSIAEAQTISKTVPNLYVVHEAYHDALIQEWHAMSYEASVQVIETKFCLQECVEEIF